MEKTKSTSWDSLKWFIKEIMKMYSSEPSYFSKKRVESGVAFVIGQWGMIYFLLEKISTMTATDIAIWAGIEFAIGGYMINQIQKEKKTEDSSK
jgi:hypothetical protein